MNLEKVVKKAMTDLEKENGDSATIMVKLAENGGWLYGTLTLRLGAMSSEIDKNHVLELSSEDFDYTGLIAAGNRSGQTYKTIRQLNDLIIKKCSKK